MELQITWPRLLCQCAMLGASLIAANTSRSETIEAEQHCAKTPTYKHFEDVQYTAYTQTSPYFYSLLKETRNQQQFVEDIKRVGEEIDKRKDSLGTSRTDNQSYSSASNDIIKQLRELQLPTCYENPLTYYLLMNYKKQLDVAKSDLAYENTDEINLATLPTVDINAHTYPAFGGKGNVLAFNVQLFMFDYQITKTLMSTIQLRQSGENISVDVGVNSAIESLKRDHNINIDFSVALLEFLGLTTPSTRPLDQAYDPILITFTQGMELFAVAHEYGHVLKRHVSPTVALPLGLMANGQPLVGRDVLTYARSWKQELEADQVGISLVMQALRTSSKQDDASALRWLYSAKGSLFFFRCLDIVDQAKYILTHEQAAATPTFADRVFLRDFADGKTSPEEDAAHKELTIGDYPPAWLRLERVEQTIEDQIAAQPPSPESADFSEIADALIGDAPIVWRAVAPRLPAVIDVVRLQNAGHLTDVELTKAKARASVIPISYDVEEFLPGCYVHVRSWSSTFLCNPDLQRAVVLFETGQDDEAVIVAYRAAVSRDRLLLSGKQAEWAVTALRTNSDKSRRHALGILGLTGDTENLRFLQALDTASWSEADRLMLARAEQLLEKGTGRR
jgi:hypothetical protein